MVNPWKFNRSALKFEDKANCQQVTGLLVISSEIQAQQYNNLNTRMSIELSNDPW